MHVSCYNDVYLIHYIHICIYAIHHNNAGNGDHFRVFLPAVFSYSEKSVKKSWQYTYALVYYFRHNNLLASWNVINLILRCLYVYLKHGNTEHLLVRNLLWWTTKTGGIFRGKDLHIPKDEIYAVEFEFTWCEQWVSMIWPKIKLPIPLPDI